MARIAALVLVFLSLALPAWAAIPAQERVGLEAIYNSLDGPTWSRKENWMGAAGTECTWANVTCDAGGATVVELDISWRNAKGVLPAQIGNLTNLEVFRANGSTLSGPLPAQIGNLTKLRILELTGYYDNIGSNGNEISGPIPPQIGQLTNLRELYLAANKLTGAIPAELGQLSNLEILDLSYNPMGGPLPASILTLSRLRSLSLARTGTTGTLVATMNLPALEDLTLSSNELTGPLPTAIGRSTKLTELYLDGNQLSGVLPAELAQLTELRDFDAYGNDFEGAFPSLGALSKLARLSLAFNRLSGTIPASIGQLQELTILSLVGNSFSGPLPAEFFTLPKLREFYSYGTQFSGNLSDFARLTTLRILAVNGGNRFRGPFGVELTRLSELRELALDGNPLGGRLPDEIGNLTNLQSLTLSQTGISGQLRDSMFATLPDLRSFSASYNDLDGVIPPALLSRPRLVTVQLQGNRLSGTITAISSPLFSLDLGDNDLSGPLPPSLAQVATLHHLQLGANRFSGAVPDWIGSLTELETLHVQDNALAGSVPASITQLQELSGSNPLLIDGNALFTTDPAVRAFLDARNPRWHETQTVPPSDLRVTAERERSITLSWTPVAYRSGPGGYVIARASSPSGPFEVLTTTPSKETTTFIVDGLETGRTHYFTLQTVSYPGGNRKSVVASAATAPVAGTTTQGAPAPASIVVFTYPGEIRQRPGGTGETSYAIGNVGDLAANITLSSNDTLFTQEPSSFTLAGGETQRITIRGKTLAAGAYVGEAGISGTGVPAGLTVRVSILVTEPPTGVVSAQPSANRIDVAAGRTESATGTVDFTNVGTDTLRGIVVSNVAWIIPPRELIVIPPRETRTVTFTVDQTKRPDASSPAGAVTGTLSLVYESGGAGKSGVHGSGGINLATPVTVVYTIKPPVDSVQFPPMGAGEVALFIAGVGNITGAKGKYISDVAIVNAFGINSPSDIRMYYSPADPSLPSKVTEVSQLQPSQGVTFGNIVGSVFDYGNLGTIQLRTTSLDQLFVNANIFNVTDRSGTYGTSLPIFRSDRALAPGESIFLTGLRRDAARTTYTNLFIQETAGQTAQYEIEYFDASGATVGPKRTGSISAFRLAVLTDSPDNPAVPTGAVAARIRNSPSSAGRIVGYATPLDTLSGDFWMVADWNRELGAALDEPVIIPVAGSLHGSLNTFYRTDVAISNRSAGAASGTFTFYDRTGARRDRIVDLAQGESTVVSDFVGALFPELGDTFGYLQFDPRGSFSLSSRTFATVPTLPGTFGTGVPALPRSAALRLGQSKIIAGLDVASTQTIVGAKPGTFRTNVGLVEIAGQPATVQVTVVYNDIKQVVSGIRLTTITYELAPYQSIIDGIAGRIQASNPNVSDLRSVQLKFQVTKGEGAVIAYTSSVDNGTADQVLRTQ